MNSRTVRVLCAVLLSSLFAWASQAAPSAADSLRLVPRPKTVATGPGQLRLGHTVVISITPHFAKEDRLPAEMLKEEIESAGVKAHVAVANVGTIHLRRMRHGESDYPSLEGAAAERFAQEGYILHVTRRGATVAAPSAAGLFYGVQTLRQLVHPEGKGTAYLPEVKIVDWPALQWRGVHDDLSRGPIPTLAYMKKQIRTLAEYKVNVYSLYMEYVFAYKSVPVAAPHEAAITADDIRELVSYAQQYHITLLPEQQAFGHLHHVLKYELYTDLAETPHGHVLSPANPGTYELIKKMYAELIPLFPGPLFHIGGDETWELGTGQTKEIAQKNGLGQVYLEHLKKVNEIVAPYHKQLMFWADIARHYPELLKILPKDAIAVAWAYDPRANFDSELKPFHDAGLPLFVAPGANNWNRMVPDFPAAYVNIRNFIRDGEKYGAIGVLNTTWDDDGEALFEMTWPALLFGADASWQGGEASIEDFQKNFDWAFYRNEGTEFNHAINELASTHELLKKAGARGAYDDLFWADPFSESGARVYRRVLPVAHELRLAAENALAELVNNREKARAHSDTLDVFIFGAQRLDTLGMKVQFADEIFRFYSDAFQNQSDRQRVNRDFGQITAVNGRLEDLRDATFRLKDLYSQRWLAEAKPYWLGSVTVRYEDAGLEIQHKIEEFRQVRFQFGGKQPLPDPEKIGLFNLMPEATKPATTPQ